MKNEQKQQREFIAFEGEKFTIEWYFDNICFFFEGQKIIVTNGFHKKTDKLPKNEKERALKIKADYETRVKRGDYYE